jgi:hypothetical protein
MVIVLLMKRSVAEKGARVGGESRFPRTLLTRGQMDHLEKSTPMMASATMPPTMLEVLAYNAAHQTPSATR